MSKIWGENVESMPVKKIMEPNLNNRENYGNQQPICRNMKLTSSTQV